MARGRVTSAQAEAEVIRLYRDERLPIQAIHTRTGISRGVIGRVIREAEIARPAGRPPAGHSSYQGIRCLQRHHGTTPLCSKL